MPELPEVENTARKLHSRLRRRTIKSVSVHWARSIATPSVQIFGRELRGTRIVRVSRRAKYLIFELRKDSRKLYLFIHLRMSGSFRFGSQGDQRKHDRVTFELNGQHLYFADTRKFGKLYLTDAPDRFTAKLGIEPFDKSLDDKLFHDLITQHRGALKPLLLNQRIIAGIGNIYADESLWRAKLHPLRIGNSLTPTESKLLLKSIRKVLDSAIRSSGTDFGDNVVCDGEYSPRIYGRAGSKCFRCRATISRTVIGQRGTSFCASCQR